MAHNSHKGNHIDRYLESNYEFTKKVFQSFVKSKSKVFFFLSSIKAANNNLEIVDECCDYEEENVYGYSKAKAERYLVSNINSIGDKKIFILRPSLIFGDNNKANISHLEKFVLLRLPWIFSNYKNSLPLLDIRNLNFVLNEFCSNHDQISSGVYNVSNGDCLELGEIYKFIGEAKGVKTWGFSVNRKIIDSIFSIGDLFRVPIMNKRFLNKITKTQIVKISKLQRTIGGLPYTTESGIKYYFK